MYNFANLQTALSMVSGQVCTFHLSLEEGGRAYNSWREGGRLQAGWLLGTWANSYGWFRSGW